MASGKDRPLLITLIAILYFVFGVLLVLGGAAILFGGMTLPKFGALTTAVGGVLLVVGLISIVIAGGFWNGWKAIWYLAVIFGIISLILDVVAIFFTGAASIIGMIIQALLLYYIFRPNVKEFFGV